VFRLVGRDDRGVCHRLTRTEDTDEELFSSHSFCGESGHKSHRKREAFRNSDGGRCYRDGRCECKGNTLLTRSTMKAGQGGRRGNERGNAYQAGSPVPSWTKKRIMRAVNRIKPAAPPIFVTSLAGLFNLSCNGVGLGGISPESC
jgi:hypothetical protein